MESEDEVLCSRVGYASCRNPLHQTMEYGMGGGRGGGGFNLRGGLGDPFPRAGGLMDVVCFLEIGSVSDLLDNIFYDYECYVRSLGK